MHASFHLCQYFLFMYKTTIKPEHADIVLLFSLVGYSPVLLKVHKIENFFGFVFEFCTVSLLIMLKYEGFVKKKFLLGHYGGGGRIIPRSLKTTGNAHFFQPRLKLLFLKIFYEPFIFAKKNFLLFDPVTVTGMALYVDLGQKCQKIFCLV